MAEQIG